MGFEAVGNLVVEALFEVGELEESGFVGDLLLEVEVGVFQLDPSILFHGLDVLLDEGADFLLELLVEVALLHLLNGLLLLLEEGGFLLLLIHRLLVPLPLHPLILHPHSFSLLHLARSLSVVGIP